MKILAIQFRYLGDAALMTPALRAIREHFPGSALHVLVAEGAVPLVAAPSRVVSRLGLPPEAGEGKAVAVVAGHSGAPAGTL